MPKRKKIQKSAKKSSHKKRASKKAVKIMKPGYYDKVDERAYSGPELALKKTEIKSGGKILKHLEEDIVKQNEEEIPLEHIADEEDALSEDPRESKEGLGIEEEESKGEEPYPEIAEAEKDSDEEEEE
jgi:hypothetical protein